MNDAVDAMERRTLAATLATALLLGVFAMNDLPVGVFQDDGHYLILARALALGDGYSYSNLPGAPAAAHFPPGYPLLLAPLWWLAPRFPANVAYFKLVNVGLLPLVALGVRELARQLGGLSVLGASFVAVVSIATVPILFLNGLLFSETAFIATLCPTLIAAERLAARGEGGSRRAAVGVGLAIGALAMLRTVGVALLPALLAVLLWRRRWWDAAFVFIGALLLLAPWQVWSVAHASEVPAAIAGGYGAYGAWIIGAWRSGGFDFAAAVLRENLRGLLMPLTLFGLAEAPRWVQAPAGIALLALAAAGAKRLSRRAPVTLLLFVPYLALLLAWPFPPDRFLWPLWPIVIMLLVLGAAALVRTDRTSLSARSAAWAVASALAVLFAAWHVRAWPARNWEALARENARVGVAAARVAAALPSDGLVATDQDAMVHLYAGRQAVPLVALTAVQHVRARSDTEVAAQIDEVLGAYRPRWVLVVQQESLRGVRLLAQRGRLRFVGADTSGVLVYDVVR